MSGFLFGIFNGNYWRRFGTASGIWFSVSNFVRLSKKEKLVSLLLDFYTLLLADYFKKMCGEYFAHLALWGRSALRSRRLRSWRRTRTSRTDPGSRTTAAGTGCPGRSPVAPGERRGLPSARWGWNWQCWWRDRWERLASLETQSRSPWLRWLEVALGDEGENHGRILAY